MPFNAATGKWEYEDDAIGPRVAGLLAKDNPLMKQAATTGLKTANRRGLLNSSMAVGAAQGEMLKVAAPIASQESAQVAARNLAQLNAVNQKDISGMDIASRENIAKMNVAASDREKSSAATAAFQNAYAEMFRTIGQNENLPADVRNAYLGHVRAWGDMNLNLIEQLYNVDLEWASPST